METGGEDDTGDMVSRKDQCETTVVENRLLEIDKVNAEVLVDMEGTEKQVTQVAEDTANVEEVSTDKINLSHQKTTQFDPGQLTLHIPTAGQVIQLPAGLRVSRTPDKRLVIFKHPPGHQADVQGASRAPPYGQRIGGQRTGSMVPPATASKACRQIVLTTQQPIGENPIIPSTNDTQDDGQLHSQGHRLSSRAGTFPGIPVVSLASLQSEPNTQDLPQLLGAQNIPIVNDTATGFGTQHIMIEHESNTSNNVAVRHLRNIDRAQNISGNLNNLTGHDHGGKPWAFVDLNQRKKAEGLIDAQEPSLFIGFPMCSAFAHIQKFNKANGDPAVVQAELTMARLHLAWFCHLCHETDQQRGLTSCTNTRRWRPRGDGAKFRSSCGR